MVLVVLGLLAWFLVIQPTRAFLEAWRLPTQTQTQINSGTATPAPNPPAPSGNVNAPVTQADVQRFVRVRRKIRDTLGNSFTGLQQVWTEIQNGQTPNVLTVVRVLGNAGSAIGHARQAEAAALASERLSPERYAVIRSTVNRALGVPNVDFARAAQVLQQGRLPDLNTAVQTATPEERALIAPYRTELTETAALGLLGL